MAMDLSVLVTVVVGVLVAEAFLGSPPPLLQPR
jgi:hypothetical protein